MKNAKKVLAMVIVLALAISMAIPVSADITIKQLESVDGVSYSAWKIATLSYNDGAYSYTAEDDWVGFFYSADPEVVAPGASYFDYDTANKVVTAKTGADGKAIAEAALAYAKTNSITATENAISADGEATFTTADKGYYLITSPIGAALIVDTAGGADGENIEITEKNDKPVLTKKVNGKVADDVAIGATVTYTLDIEVKAGAVNYVVTDTLPAGITYDETFTPTITEITGLTVSAAPAPNKQSVVFTLNGEDKAIGETVTITYKAKVGSIESDTQHVNEATLVYGVDANGDGKGDNTANTDAASVYTWSFELFKYTGDDTPLPGAKFELYDGTTKLTFSRNGNVYTYDPAGTVDTLESDSGNYTIKGLDSKTYTLKEKEAPAGYNALTTDETVTITGSLDNTTETMSKGVDYNFDLNGDSKNDVFGVKNNTGLELPQTGGTGTVIFVVVGSFLVLAMGVLLVVRKRMSKVVYTR